MLIVPLIRRTPMQSTLLRRWLVALTVVSALGLTVATAPASAAPARAEVDSGLLAELSAQGSARFLVYLREQADLTGVAATADRAKEVYRRLTATADRSQRDLREVLDRAGQHYQSYWIANAVQVT